MVQATLAINVFVNVMNAYVWAYRFPTAQLTICFHNTIQHSTTVLLAQAPNGLPACVELSSVNDGHECQSPASQERTVSFGDS